MSAASYPALLIDTALLVMCFFSLLLVLLSVYQMHMVRRSLQASAPVQLAEDLSQVRMTLATLVELLDRETIQKIHTDIVGLRTKLEKLEKRVDRMEKPRPDSGG